MTLTIRDFTEQDIERLNNVGFNGKSFSEDRKVLEFEDETGATATMYIDDWKIDQLGEDYIRDNATLEHSEVLEHHVVTLSQANFYNDLIRFPAKEIEVEYVRTKEGERTQIYKCEKTGKYYLRMLCNEPFARWMSATNRGELDVANIRANITFVHNGQKETVTYNDYNGNAAYSDTFNKDF